MLSGTVTDDVLKSEKDIVIRVKIKSPLQLLFGIVHAMSSVTSN